MKRLRSRAGWGIFAGLIFAGTLFYFLFFRTVPVPPPAQGRVDWQAEIGLPSRPVNDWKEEHLVAHAFGSVDEAVYTNSKEALSNSYRRGIRVFEVDLILTREGNVVCAHDWRTFRKLTIDPALKHSKRPLDYETFVRSKIHGYLTPLTFWDVLDFLRRYPGTYVITDTKTRRQSAARRIFREIVREAKAVDPELLDRIIPQIYNRPMLQTVESVYPFKEYCYTLYLSKDTDEEVVRFVRDAPKVTAVSFPADRVTENFCMELNGIRAKMFIHTVNSVEEMKRYAGFGARGFYSDLITYEDLTENVFCREE